MADRQGQTMVEYLLLFLVAVSLAAILFRSKIFTDFLSSDSPFFNALTKDIEYSYRHGRGPWGKEDNANLEQHPTFYNADENSSRFFSPTEPYPSE